MDKGERLPAENKHNKERTRKACYVGMTASKRENAGTDVLLLRAAGS